MITIVMSAVCLFAILAISKYRHQKEYVLTIAAIVHEMIYSISELVSSGSKVVIAYQNFGKRFFLNL